LAKLNLESSEQPSTVRPAIPRLSCPYENCCVRVEALRVELSPDGRFEKRLETGNSDAGVAQQSE
jgi:hypothetical protein